MFRDLVIPIIVLHRDEADATMSTRLRNKHRYICENMFCLFEILETRIVSNKVAYSKEFVF